MHALWGYERRVFSILSSYRFYISKTPESSTSSSVPLISRCFKYIKDLKSCHFHSLESDRVSHDPLITNTMKAFVSRISNSFHYNLTPNSVFQSDVQLALAALFAVATASDYAAPAYGDNYGAHEPLVLLRAPAPRPLKLVRTYPTAGDRYFLLSSKNSYAAPLAAALSASAYDTRSYDAPAADYAAGPALVAAPAYQAPAPAYDDGALYENAGYEAPALRLVAAPAPAYDAPAIEVAAAPAYNAAPAYAAPAYAAPTLVEVAAPAYGQYEAALPEPAAYAAEPEYKKK